MKEYMSKQELLKYLEHFEIPWKENAEKIKAKLAEIKEKHREVWLNIDDFMQNEILNRDPKDIIRAYYEKSYERIKNALEKNDFLEFAKGITGLTLDIKLE